MSPNSNDYRLYLDERFSSLTTSMNGQFKEVHDRLDKIELQTSRTNGNVTHLELEIEKKDAELLKHALNCTKSKDIDKIKDDIDEIRKDLEDYRFFKRYPKLGILIIVCFILAMLSAIYSTYSSFVGAQARTTLQKSVNKIDTDNQHPDTIQFILRGNHYDPFARDTNKTVR